MALPNSWPDLDPPAKSELFAGLKDKATRGDKSKGVTAVKVEVWQCYPEQESDWQRGSPF